MRAHDAGGVNGTRPSGHYWRFQMGRFWQKNKAILPWQQLEPFTTRSVFLLWKKAKVNGRSYLIWTSLLENRSIRLRFSGGTSTTVSFPLLSPIPMISGLRECFSDAQLDYQLQRRDTGDLLLHPDWIQMSQSCMRNTLFDPRGVSNWHQSWAQIIKGALRRVNAFKCPN